MQFVVERTSTIFHENIKPCEEAYRQKVIRVDERGFETPKEYENTLHENWYGEGVNHKIVPPNGNYKTPHIYRELEGEEWAIDISSLEELLDFKEKYGNLIIGTYFGNKGINVIEIYDDWRE